MTRRVLTLVFAVAAVGAIVFAAQLAQTGDDIDDPVLSGQDVERLIPPRNTEILAQEAVGIDLATGYTGVLIVNGVEIPEDQLIRRNGLDEILYRPAESDPVVPFLGGENCVVALVWPVEKTRLEARTISWCFNVT